jgi:hypothetical protein
MTCEGCQRDKTAGLSGVRTVCTWCIHWLIECEARYLLALPLPERRAALQERERVRRSVKALKDAMARIHAQR